MFPSLAVIGHYVNIFLGKASLAVHSYVAGCISPGNRRHTALAGLTVAERKDGLS
jgi:hypothetical protein